MITLHLFHFFDRILCSCSYNYPLSLFLINVYFLPYLVISSFIFHCIFPSFSIALLDASSISAAILKTSLISMFCSPFCFSNVTFYCFCSTLVTVSFFVLFVNHFLPNSIFYIPVSDFSLPPFCYVVLVFCCAIVNISF